jgi:hypothetical protein
MESQDEAEWYGAVAGIVALLLIVQATVSGGVLEAEFGPYAALFWLLVILWFLIGLLAVLRRQFLWVALTAPIILYALFMGSALLLACSRGNCV